MYVPGMYVFMFVCLFFGGACMHKYTRACMHAHTLTHTHTHNCRTKLDSKKVIGMDSLVNHRYS